jgi:hypothetical protein
MKQFANAATGLGATEHSAAAIEASFEALLDLLSAHFMGGYEYMLGGRPTLADFAMMGPLYAHLFRDPVPGKLVRTRAPLVGSWIERVMGHPTAVLFEPHPLHGTLHPAAHGEGRGGGALASDVPATLIAALSHMLDEYVPVLQDIGAIFVEQNYELGVEVPRAMGMMDFDLRGTHGKRGAGTFDLWMAQRFFDELATSPVDTTEWVVDAFGAAGKGLLSMRDGFAPRGELRVKRVQNKLLRGYRAPAEGYSEYEGRKSKL